MCGKINVSYKGWKMNNTEIFYNHMFKLIQSGKVPMEIRRNGFMAEKYDINRYALNLLLQLNYVKNNPDAKVIFSPEYIGQYIKDGGLEKPVMGSVIMQEFNPISGRKLTSSNLKSETFEILYPTQSKKDPNVFLPSKSLILGARVPRKVVPAEGLLLEDIPAQEGIKKVVFPGDVMFFPYDANKSVALQVDKYADLGAKYESWGVDPPKWMPCYEDGEFKDSRFQNFYSEYDNCME